MIRIVATLALAVSAAACAPQVLYDDGPGPHATVVREAVVRDPAHGRDIAVRVVAPAGKGSYPVVVFSHGAFCYPQQYDGVVAFWASHGYVVVEPNHVDSPNNAQRMTGEQAKTLLESRIGDLTLVTDSIGRIAADAGIEATPDTARMAIAGHSFGGMLAAIKAGLVLKDPATGAAVDRSDARFRVAVIMSGVGPMPQMADNAFAGLTRPLIASGGTLDEGNVGTGEIFPWEWRMSPYTLAPRGDKYGLVLDHADHYLGGLICRAGRGGEDDPGGLAIVRAVQTTFLDAYLKDDAAAHRFLATADVAALTAGRARLDRK